MQDNKPHLPHFLQLLQMGCVYMRIHFTLVLQQRTQ